MGGSQSQYRRRSRRHFYTDHPGSLPMTPEDVFSGHYMSYQGSPTTPYSPMDQMDDPYFQYAGFSGALRRVNSDSHLAYNPYMQYPMAQGKNIVMYLRYLGTLDGYPLQYHEKKKNNV